VILDRPIDCTERRQVGSGVEGLNESPPDSVQAGRKPLLSTAAGWHAAFHNTPATDQHPATGNRQPDQ
jgi:hypothetical protein